MSTWCVAGKVHPSMDPPLSTVYVFVGVVVRLTPSSGLQCLFSVTIEVTVFSFPFPSIQTSHLGPFSTPHSPVTTKT